MNDIIFCFTLDDIGYDGYSSEQHLSQLLEFWRTEGLKATLFMVPLFDGHDMRERAAYVELLERAIAEGHEVAQHGLTHDRFECGIPPQMILSLAHEGPARERLANHREAIERDLAVDRIRERLRQGRRIVSDILGWQVPGFRAPCLSICDNLFDALEADGYTWDSSRHLQHWDHMQGKLDTPPEPITFERFQGLQYPGRLKTLPLTTDYTWYLTRERYQPTLDLATHDLFSCAQAGIPFVPIAHVSPIFEGEDAAIGLQLYRDLLTYARQMAHEQDRQLRFITLSEACESI